MNQIRMEREAFERKEKARLRDIERRRLEMLKDIKDGIQKTL